MSDIVRHPATPARAASDAPPLQRGLAFVMGALLPLVTMQRMLNETSADVADRVIPADFAAALAAVVLMMAGRLVVPRLLLVYVAAVVTALGIAVSNAAPGEEIAPFTSFVALGMAGLYFVVASSLASDRSTLTALLAGVAMGVLWESVIGVHDYFSHSQWFPDVMEGRVRGTFKKSGQLAAYAFSAVTMVLSLGPDLSRRPLMKRLSIAAGVLGMFLVVASSRRSAILSIAAGVVVFLFVGARQSHTRMYRTTLGLSVALLAIVFVALPLLEGSMLGQRFAKSADNVAGGENWTMLEIREASSRWTEWFPFGAGLGRGWIYGATGDHELHDGHLALLVEMGLFGTLSFYALIASPLLFGSRRALGGSRVMMHAIVAASLTAGFAFMLHNRLHRDRMFMVYLGATMPAQMGAMADERRRAIVRTRGSDRTVHRTGPHRTPRGTATASLNREDRPCRTADRPTDRPQRPVRTASPRIP